MKKAYQVIGGVLVAACGFVATVFEPLAFMVFVLSSIYVARHMMTPKPHEREFPKTTTDATKVSAYLASQERKNQQLSLVASAYFLVVMGVLSGAGFIVGGAMAQLATSINSGHETLILSVVGAMIFAAFAAKYWLTGLWAARIDVVFGPQSEHPSYALLIKENEITVHGTVEPSAQWSRRHR